MKIYDEITGAELTAPDERKGCTYPGQRQVGTRREILAGTAALYPPDGLQHEVPVYEDCLLYHTYTDAELEAMEQAQQPTQLERVEAQATYTAMMTDTLLEG